MSEVFSGQIFDSCKKLLELGDVCESLRVFGIELLPTDAWNLHLR